MKTFSFILIILLLIFGCDRDKESYDISNPILVMAYSDDYFYPAGFFYEIIDSGSIYYVNTVSIKPLNDREDIWIDLSCDNIDLARLWSELTDSFSSYHRIPESERETNRYFEFKWVGQFSRRDMVLARVHKESYFKPLLDKFRSSFVYGISNKTDTIGQIDITKFQSANIKELIEYLWSSGAVGVNEKVEKAELEETISSYTYLVSSISMIGGDWNLSDSINLYYNYFNINKMNGIITLNRQFKQGFYGKHH
jgi:hypothetical protein